MVAARIATLALGTNQHASIEAPSQIEAAELLNVSRSSVQRARQVQAQGAPALVSAVEQGSVSVSAAAEVASLPLDLAPRHTWTATPTKPTFAATPRPVL